MPYASTCRKNDWVHICKSALRYSVMECKKEREKEGYRCSEIYITKR